VHAPPVAPTSSRPDSRSVAANRNSRGHWSPVVSIAPIAMPPNHQPDEPAVSLEHARPLSDVALPLTGGCNCGAVRYEVTKPLVRASYCHCKRCQRRTGAAASPQAHPAPGTFRIVAGQEKLRMWKPPAGGGEKWFCGDCGSPIFGAKHQPPRVDRHPDGDVRPGSGAPATTPRALRYLMPNWLGSVLIAMSAYVGWQSGFLMLESA
jgi:hypothetical protein